MTIDAHKNFAWSTVATAPSPATSGTSLVVASGEGAAFPAVPFNAVVCPAGTQPTNANAEIIRVTARSTDTFSTIVRTQEGTSARTIIVGDQVFAAVTAATLTDIESGLVDRQVFTSSGTWTKPAGARRVRVVGVGGGGGGGAGRRGAAASVRCGGGGGAGAGWGELFYWASDLGATVAVTVGAGGAGGTAAPTDDTTGGAGGAGGNSIFGTTVPVFALGAGGSGGSATSGAGGIGQIGSNSGAAASTTGLTGVRAAACYMAWQPVGGASGAGVTSANAESIGATGQNNFMGTASTTVQAAGASGGGSAAQVGSPISLATLLYACNPAYGGASGGSSLAGAGGAGAAAQGYGCGGGGGGGGLNGFTGGAGGAGAPGLVIVESWT